MAIDVSDLRVVAEATARLGLPHAFAGGAVLPLLLDHPHLTPGRPTGDVDVIVEVVTRIEVVKMETELERLKFGHDIEDILAVVDGRAALLDEMASAPADMRRHVASTLRNWLATSAFNESLSGHLQPDAGNQGRLPLLRARLADLAALG